MLQTQATRAAQYVRMSTEHQRYSIERQTIANTVYALAHGFEIVRTYVDAGISGLTLEKRKGLKTLLADVLGGHASFSAILVYDVSRWGRFQDPDEAAHYEFVCRAAGVRVEYCAERFDNDGSLTSTLVKQLKRAMAAEYSRELSDRMTQTKAGLGGRGYWMGGSPGYGLRRCLIDGAGARGAALEDGELSHKVGHRTGLAPGPANEVAVVRRIFRMFTARQLTPPAIARRLNADEIPFRGGRVWTDTHVRTVLRNELYIGTLVMGRDKVRLGVCAKQPEAAWVRVPMACEPIIGERLFRRAQRLAVRFRHRSKDELLESLRAFIREKGHVSSRLLREDPQMPDPNVFRFHFGALTKAYELAGYVMTDRQRQASARLDTHRGKAALRRRGRISDEDILRRLKALLQTQGALNLALIGMTRGLPGRTALIRRFGSIERTYELVGYAPGTRQQQCFAREAARRRKNTISEPDHTPLGDPDGEAFQGSFRSEGRNDE